METIGTNNPPVIYEAESEEEKAKLEKLYNYFISQYDIKPHKTELIVKKTVNDVGIEISPKEGSIFQITAIKSTSKLEIKLKDNDLRRGGSSMFEKKDYKFIIVNYNYKEE
jgi:hypothetical protein